MNRKCFVFGSINLDYVFHLPKFPFPGETLHSEDFHLHYGGKAANQALAIAKLGGHSFLLGDIGTDQQGKEMIDNLKSYGVNIEGVSLHPNAHTGMAIIYVSNKNNQIVLHSGANDCFNVSHFINTLDLHASKSDCFITQFEKASQAIEQAVKEAKARQMFIVCNPSPMNVELLQRIKSDIDILVLNEVEYLQITNKPYKGKNESKFPNLIITLGEQGSHAHINGEHVYQPIVPTDVVDTTGAGDTFLGGFIARYMKTDDLAQSLRFASKAASLKVSRRGAQAGIPRLTEIIDESFVDRGE